MSSLSNFSKRFSKSEQLISDLFDDILLLMQWTSSHGAIAAYQTQGSHIRSIAVFFFKEFLEKM
jgi:hypothetical protein